MRVDRVVQTIELGRVVERGAGDMVERAAANPAHGEQELEIDDVELLAREERSLAQQGLDLVGPKRQVGCREPFAGRLFGLCIGDLHRRTDLPAQIFHVAHQRFVARRLERIARMKTMQAPHEHQDGVRLTDGPVTWPREVRHSAERGGRLPLEPRSAREALVVEVDPSDVQRQATLLATAHGGIEIGQLGL